MKFAINGNTNSDSAFKPRTARAYCEGRAYFINVGGVAGDNPFAVGREDGNRAAWAQGYIDAALSVPASETHCAI